LESSDVDGGSSVAVLTYLRRILEALDHPDMIHLILHYLLALPDTATTPTASKASVSAARKRKSMDLATMMATQVEMASTPALFNLVDLIQGSLRSQSQQTISVTLQLVSVILRRHHRYAVTTLLWTSQILADRPQRSVGAHEKEMDFLLTLAGDVGGDVSSENDFDEVYENHVKDCMGILESHPCSIVLVAPKSPGGTTKFPGSQATIPGAPRDIRSHTLRPEDPMLKTMLGILSTFFTNSVETNLSLTGTIIDLATCGYMRIDGWLVPDPASYVYEEDEEDDPEEPLLNGIDDPIEIQEKSQLRALNRARRVPKWNESHLPPILQLLKTLADQVSTYRSEIPRFEDILQQRRDAFQAASSATATPIPIRQAPLRSSFESSSRSASPPRNVLDSLAQRIFPELGTPSRSRSPRGRSSQDQQRGSVSGGYGFATPTTSRNNNIPPPQFPMGLETPSRGSSRAFSPSPLRGKRESKDIPPSQAAAFAAVDQSILARKVGLPTPKGELTPIPFPNLRSTGSPDSEGSKDRSEKTEEASERGGKGEAQKKEEKLVSVSHVLTNVIVLQEFLLELAALVQVRAGLFAEVRFG